MNSPEMLWMHPYDLVYMFQGELLGAHLVCYPAHTFPHYVILVTQTTIVSNFVSMTLVLV